MADAETAAGNGGDTGFGRRFAEVVEEFGGIAALRNATGFSTTAIQKWMHGESTPNVWRLQLIAQTGGVRVEWLVSGMEPKYDATVLGSLARLKEVHFTPPLLSDHPWLDSRVARRLEKTWAPYRPIISATELLGEGIDPHGVALASARGDSMAPTLLHGDAVLVDTGDVSPRNGVWALVDDGGHLQFVRIWSQLQNMVRVGTDSHQEELGVSMEDLQASICGRVIWSWRRSHL